LIYFSRLDNFLSPLEKLFTIKLFCTKAAAFFCHNLAVVAVDRQKKVPYNDTAA